MCSKKKEKKNYVEVLDVVIEKLRNHLEEKDHQLEQVKSTITMEKFGPIFQKGETSFHVGKNNTLGPKKPVVKDVINYDNIRGKKKQIHKQQKIG